MMATDRATAVLVVGMHRSGTSALAGVLDKLGIPLGSRLLEPGDDNPKGYWEHQDVVAVHERLLQALGCRWDDVRALPSDWLSGEAAVRAAAALQDIITRDFSGNPVWAVKDPRLCRFLPLWLNVLGRMNVRPVVLFIAREPAEVSASIEARNHWVPPFGEILWLRYVTDAVAASVHVPREVVLFDDFLSQPLVVTQNALSRLGVSIPKQSQEQLRSAVESFVDKADRHHQRVGMLKSEPGFAAVAHKLYLALAGVSHGKTAWTGIEQGVAAFRSEWLKCGAVIDAMADMAMKIAADARGFEIERHVVASQLNAQIQWSEQAKQKHEILQVENAELSSKLMAQTQWSEGAQKKNEALQAENAELSSKLTAQVQWSGGAQKKNEVLQAENAELSSKLTAQIQWSEGAQRRNGVLQAENAELSSKLTMEIQSSKQATSKFEVLRTEFTALSATSAKQASGLSVLKAELDDSESVRRELAAKLQRALDEAERAQSDLIDQLQHSKTEYETLSNALATELERKTVLESELRAVYASRSWRVTKPFRSAALRFGAKAAQKTDDKRDAE